MHDTSKENYFKLLISLFIEFFKVGIFTFGGGYAMIAMITHICVEKQKWINHDDMMNISVIAESTPGPMALNCATFVGYKKAGFPGSVIASIAMVIPSFLIICFIAFYCEHFLTIKWIANAFKGIKIAVGLIILDAGLTMIKEMQKKAFPIAVMLCNFLVMLFSYLFSWKLSSVTLLIISAFSAFIFFSIKKDKKIKAGDNAPSKKEGE